jgi:hypothetical protein
LFFFRALRYLLKKGIESPAELCAALNLSASSSTSVIEDLASKLAAYPEIFVINLDSISLITDHEVILSRLLPLANNVTMLPIERYHLLLL